MLLQTSCFQLLLLRQQHFKGSVSDYLLYSPFLLCYLLHIFSSYKNKEKRDIATQIWHRISTLSQSSFWETHNQQIKHYESNYSQYTHKISTHTQHCKETSVYRSWFCPDNGWMQNIQINNINLLRIWIWNIQEGILQSRECDHHQPWLWLQQMLADTWTRQLQWLSSRQMRTWHKCSVSLPTQHPTPSLVSALRTSPTPTKHFIATT